ncbi:MAG: Arc family DNA-binding protein [Prevotellaceae bacterium]|jgi:hypothetical protein|nr:Arc family DNA-binding protein [Prevotellaceae bacterium]
MTKKKFVLRIDSDLLEAVEKWASDEFRSVNGQLEWLISDTLKRYKRSKKKTEEKKTEENP